MAVHNPVSVKSFHQPLVEPPAAFRRRVLPRRAKKSSPGRMAAAGASGGTNARRNLGGATSRGIANAVTKSSWPEGLDQLGHLPDDSAPMYVDLDGRPGGGGGVGSGTNDDSSFRLQRVSSCPGMPGGSNVSSVRGITMDFVHGSVRAKTPPATLSACYAAAAAETEAAAQQRPKSAAGLPSMVDLAAAVNEAARPSPLLAEAAAAATTRAPRATEVKAGLVPGIVDQRYLAASSGPLPTTFPAGGSQKGPNKRVKSGVSDAGARGVPVPLAAEGEAAMAVDGGRGYRMEERHGRQHQQVQPTPANALSMRITAAVAAAAAAATASPPLAPASPSSVVTGEAVGGAAKATSAPAGAAAAAGEDTPMTNDQWVGLLSPLMRAAPAGTHPEDFLHGILRERGYSTEMVPMKETAFHRQPVPSQVAAYDKAILRAVLDEDEAELERMRVEGRRMDACNRFGDSVLHMACRRGRVAALRYLLRVCGPGGVVLSDDFGRSVMHDACWTATPRFDVVSAVLDTDSRLVRLLDSRGSSPLQYVPQDQWPLWCAFFESRKEVYWPQLAPGAEDVAGVIPRKTNAAS